MEPRIRISKGSSSSTKSNGATQHSAAQRSAAQPPPPPPHTHTHTHTHRFWQNWKGSNRACLLSGRLACKALPAGFPICQPSWGKHGKAFLHILFCRPLQRVSSPKNHGSQQKSFEGLLFPFGEAACPIPWVCLTRNPLWMACLGTWVQGSAREVGALPSSALRRDAYDTLICPKAGTWHRGSIKWASAKWDGPPVSLFGCFFCFCSGTRENSSLTRAASLFLRVTGQLGVCVCVCAFLAFFCFFLRGGGGEQIQVFMFNSRSPGVDSLPPRSTSAVFSPPPHERYPATLLGPRMPSPIEQP